MTEVSYRARFTRNMGDYESLQIEVGVGDETRGDEKVAEAYNRVKDFVESRLLDAVEELESQIAGVRVKVSQAALEAAAKHDLKKGK